MSPGICTHTHTHSTHTNTHIHKHARAWACPGLGGEMSDGFPVPGALPTVLYRPNLLSSAIVPDPNPLSLLLSLFPSFLSSSGRLGLWKPWSFHLPVSLFVDCPPSFHISQVLPSPGPLIRPPVLHGVQVSSQRQNRGPGAQGGSCCPRGSELFWGIRDWIAKYKGMYDSN